MAKKIDKDWNTLVNHRMIVKPTSGRGRDDEDREREYTLTEVSASGERIKFLNTRGKSFWCPKDEYSLVEDLGPTKV